MASRQPQPLFRPKLLTTLPSYRWSQFLADSTAGVLVGIVALPLAISFAISSGVTPDKGLATAIVAGFFISLLGGSRVQIGGPTGAFVVIVYSIVDRYGVDGLTVCTLMAGLLLIAMGFLRMGSVIKFIPYPVTVGFTSGIAVIIFSQQIRDLLGLQTGALPADFLGKWASYARTLGTADGQTMALSAFSLALLLVWPRVSRRLPGPLIALLAATAAVRAFGLHVETIGSRFGALPSGLPRFSFPHTSLAQVKQLVGPAVTVALLGSIESLLSATVADGMIDGTHRSNTELIGQGVANVFSSLFGGIPATGAIARTATNVKNGGRTPVAGIMHSLTLLLIVLLFGRWATLIPLCALAAILVVVAWHMSEWHAFRALLRSPRMDVAVLVATFALTVFVDLAVAVEVGMVLSAMLFMKRMTDVTSVREVTHELREGNGEEARLEAVGRIDLPEGVAVFEAEGAFFFGAAEALRDNFNLGADAPRALILRMRHVLALDASGLRALSDLNRACVRAGTRLILAGLHSQPRSAMERSGFLRELGEKNVFRNLEEAARHVDEPAERPRS
jgi:sulfate permease, SulP family